MRVNFTISIENDLVGLIEAYVKKREINKSRAVEELLRKALGPGGKPIGSVDD